MYGEKIDISSFLGASILNKVQITFFAWEKIFSS